MRCMRPHVSIVSGSAFPKCSEVSMCGCSSFFGWFDSTVMKMLKYTQLATAPQCKPVPTFLCLWQLTEILLWNTENVAWWIHIYITFSKREILEIKTSHFQTQHYISNIRWSIQSGPNHDCHGIQICSVALINVLGVWYV